MAAVIVKAYIDSSLSLRIGGYITVKLFSLQLESKCEKSMCSCLYYLLKIFFFFPSCWVRAKLNSWRKTFLKIYKIGFMEREFDNLKGLSEGASPLFGASYSSYP